jgi:hypothetical protein
MRQFKRLLIILMASAAAVLGAAPTAHAAEGYAYVEAPYSAAFILPNFASGSSAYVDVDVWDTACDGRSALAWVIADFGGSSGRISEGLTNGQGCNTVSSWDQLYMSASRPILAVRVRTCRTAPFITLTGYSHCADSNWVDNPRN